MKKITYTKQQLLDAIKNNISLAGTLNSLGLKPSGGNYKQIKKYIQLYQIDVSHLKGKGHLKGRNHNWAKTLPIEEILVEYSIYNSNKLRIRLLKEKFFERKCYNWSSNPCRRRSSYSGSKIDNSINLSAIIRN